MYVIFIPNNIYLTPPQIVNTPWCYLLQIPIQFWFALVHYYGFPKLGLTGLLVPRNHLVLGGSTRSWWARYWNPSRPTILVILINPLWYFFIRNTICLSMIMNLVSVVIIFNWVLSFLLYFYYYYLYLFILSYILFPFSLMCSFYWHIISSLTPIYSSLNVDTVYIYTIYKDI